jgi:hypothetical protein
MDLAGTYRLFVVPLHVPSPAPRWAHLLERLVRAYHVVAPLYRVK